MATLLSQTPWTFPKSTGVTQQSVTIPAATAGSTLVLVSQGGAQITAHTGTAGGPAFTRRTQALGTLAVSIADIVTSGGETTVVLTLNGAENISGEIYELAGLGAFIAAANNGTGVTAAISNDFQAAPTSAVTVATGAAVLVGAWALAATLAALPFGAANQWRQFGPLGKIYSSGGNQPGSATQFIYASGLADVTAAASYPANLSAGQYKATSVFIASATCFAAQALYADASGLATNPAPANPVAGENSLPGAHNSNWFTGSGGVDSSIAGYTDKSTYQPGDTVSFQVDSSGDPYRVEVYRLGWYGSDIYGARNVLGNQAGYITGTITTQGTPSVDSTLGSASCAWTTTATWAIPAAAVPGLYLVVYHRTDVTTHLAIGHFIVRAAAATGLAAVVLPDYTWQAYNTWGATTDTGGTTGGDSGRSLYELGSDVPSNFAHRSYAADFRRPYATQSNQPNTYLFDAEHGVIAFLESQGYNLGYFGCGDLDASTTLLNDAALVLMLGHHEYWTTGVYDCFTHAVDNGVNMAVVSSNTALWHVRFAAADTAKRTMICYKDSGTVDVSAGFTGTGLDPLSYTGTWRDSRTGGSVNNTDIRRENALTGQLFVASVPAGVALTVPFASKAVPCWRNSAGVQSLTSGQSYTMPVSMSGGIGTESDAPDGSAGQPPGLVNLCPTSASFTSGANAAGSTYTASITPTVGWTLYRRASGALVYCTGNWRGWQGVSRWAQRLLASPVANPDANWQNAVMAILFDLGQAPAALTAMRPGTDTAPPDPSVGAPGGTRDHIAAAYGVSAQGSATGSITLGGTATAAGPVAATGAGALAVTGTATAQAPAAAAGSVTLSGAGSAAAPAAAAGSVALAGAAAAAGPGATASGAIALAGTAAARAAATAAGAITLAGTASGSAGAPSPFTVGVLTAATAPASTLTAATTRTGGSS